MKYIEKSRLANKKAYTIANILNIILMAIGVFGFSIGVSTVDYNEVAGFTLIAIGYISIGILFHECVPYWREK